MFWIIYWIPVFTKIEITALVQNIEVQTKHV